MQFLLGTLYLVAVDVLSRRWLTVFTPLWMSIVYFVYVRITRDVSDWSLLGLGLLLSLVLAAGISCGIVFASRRRS